MLLLYLIDPGRRHFKDNHLQMQITKSVERDIKQATTPHGEKTLRSSPSTQHLPVTSTSSLSFATVPPVFNVSSLNQKKSDSSSDYDGFANINVPASSSLKRRSHVSFSSPQNQPFLQSPVTPKRHETLRDLTRSRIPDNVHDALLAPSVVRSGKEIPSTASILASKASTPIRFIPRSRSAMPKRMDQSSSLSASSLHRQVPLHGSSQLSHSGSPSKTLIRSKSTFSHQTSGGSMNQSIGSLFMRSGGISPFSVPFDDSMAKSGTMPIKSRTFDDATYQNPLSTVIYSPLQSSTAERVHEDSNAQIDVYAPSTKLPTGVYSHRSATPRKYSSTDGILIPMQVDNQDTVPVNTACADDCLADVRSTSSRTMQKDENDEHSNISVRKGEASSDVADESCIKSSIEMNGWNDSSTLHRKRPDLESSFLNSEKSRLEAVAILEKLKNLSETNADLIPSLAISDSKQEMFRSTFQTSLNNMRDKAQQTVSALSDIAIRPNAPNSRKSDNVQSGTVTEDSGRENTESMKPLSILELESLQYDISVLPDQETFSFQKHSAYPNKDLKDLHSASKNTDTSHLDENARKLVERMQLMEREWELKHKQLELECERLKQQLPGGARTLNAQSSDTNEHYPITTAAPPGLTLLDISALESDTLNVGSISKIEKSDINEQPNVIFEFSDWEALVTNEGDKETIKRDVYITKDSLNSSDTISLEQLEPLDEFYASRDGNDSTSAKTTPIRSLRQAVSMSRQRRLERSMSSRSPGLPRSPPSTPKVLAYTLVEAHSKDSLENGTTVQQIHAIEAEISRLRDDLSGRESSLMTLLREERIKGKRRQQEKEEELKRQQHHLERLNSLRDSLEQDILRITCVADSTRVRQIPLSPLSPLSVTLNSPLSTTFTFNTPTGTKTRSLTLPIPNHLSETQSSELEPVVSPGGTKFVRNASRIRRLIEKEMIKGMLKESQETNDQQEYCDLANAVTRSEVDTATANAESCVLDEAPASLRSKSSPTESRFRARRRLRNSASSLGPTLQNIASVSEDNTSTAPLTSVSPQEIAGFVPNDVGTMTSETASINPQEVQNLNIVDKDTQKSIDPSPSDCTHELSPATPMNATSFSVSPSPQTPKTNTCFPGTSPKRSPIQQHHTLSRYMMDDENSSATQSGQKKASSSSPLNKDYSKMPGTPALTRKERAALSAFHQQVSPSHRVPGTDKDVVDKPHKKSLGSQIGAASCIRQVSPVNTKANSPSVPHWDALTSPSPQRNLYSQLHNIHLSGVQRPSGFTASRGSDAMTAAPESSPSYIQDGFTQASALETRQAPSLNRSASNPVISLLPLTRSSYLGRRVSPILARVPINSYALQQSIIQSNSRGLVSTLSSATKNSVSNVSRSQSIQVQRRNHSLPSSPPLSTAEILTQNVLSRSKRQSGVMEERIRLAKRLVAQEDESSRLDEPQTPLGHFALGVRSSRVITFDPSTSASSTISFSEDNSRRTEVFMNQDGVILSKKIGGDTPSGIINSIIDEQFVPHFQGGEVSTSAYESLHPNSQQDAHDSFIASEDSKVDTTTSFGLSNRDGSEASTKKDQVPVVEDGAIHDTISTANSLISNVTSQASIPRSFPSRPTDASASQRFLSPKKSLSPRASSLFKSASTTSIALEDTYVGSATRDLSFSDLYVPEDRPSLPILRIVKIRGAREKEELMQAQGYLQSSRARSAPMLSPLKRSVLRNSSSLSVSIPHCAHTLSPTFVPTPRIRSEPPFQTSPSKSLAESQLLNKERTRQEFLREELMGKSPSTQQSSQTIEHDPLFVGALQTTIREKAKDEAQTAVVIQNAMTMVSCVTTNDITPQCNDETSVSESTNKNEFFLNNSQLFSEKDVTDKAINSATSAIYSPMPLTTEIDKLLDLNINDIATPVPPHVITQNCLALALALNPVLVDQVLWELFQLYSKYGDKKQGRDKRTMHPTVRDSIQILKASMSSSWRPDTATSIMKLTMPLYNRLRENLDEGVHQEAPTTRLKINQWTKLCLDANLPDEVRGGKSLFKRGDISVTFQSAMARMAKVGVEDSNVLMWKRDSFTMKRISRSMLQIGLDFEHFCQALIHSAIKKYIDIPDATGLLLAFSLETGGENALPTSIQVLETISGDADLLSSELQKLAIPGSRKAVEFPDTPPFLAYRLLLVKNLLPLAVHSQIIDDIYDICITHDGRIRRSAIEISPKPDFVSSGDAGFDPSNMRENDCTSPIIQPPPLAQFSPPHSPLENALTRSPRDSHPSSVHSVYQIDVDSNSLGMREFDNLSHSDTLPYVHDDIKPYYLRRHELEGTGYNRRSMRPIGRISSANVHNRLSTTRTHVLLQDIEQAEIRLIESMKLDDAIVAAKKSQRKAENSRKVHSFTSVSVLPEVHDFPSVGATDISIASSPTSSRSLTMERIPSLPEKPLSEGTVGSLSESSNNENEIETVYVDFQYDSDASGDSKEDHPSNADSPAPLVQQNRHSALPTNVSQSTLSDTIRKLSAEIDIEVEQFLQTSRIASTDNFVPDEVETIDGRDPDFPTTEMSTSEDEDLRSLSPVSSTKSSDNSLSPSLSPFSSSTASSPLQVPLSPPLSPPETDYAKKIALSDEDLHDLSPQQANKFEENENISTIDYDIVDQVGDEADNSLISSSSLLHRSWSPRGRLPPLPTRTSPSVHDDQYYDAVRSPKSPSYLAMSYGDTIRSFPSLDSVGIAMPRQESLSPRSRSHSASSGSTLDEAELIPSPEFVPDTTMPNSDENVGKNRHKTAELWKRVVSSDSKIGSEQHSISSFGDDTHLPSLQNPHETSVAEKQNEMGQSITNAPNSSRGLALLSEVLGIPPDSITGSTQTHSQLMDRSDNLDEEKHGVAPSSTSNINITNHEFQSAATSVGGSPVGASDSSVEPVPDKKSPAEAEATTIESTSTLNFEQKVDQVKNDHLKLEVSGQFVDNADLNSLSVLRTEQSLPQSQTESTLADGIHAVVPVSPATLEADVSIVDPKRMDSYTRSPQFTFAISPDSAERTGKVLTPPNPRTLTFASPEPKTNQSLESALSPMVSLSQSTDGFRQRARSDDATAHTNQIQSNVYNPSTHEQGMHSEDAQVMTTPPQKPNAELTPAASGGPSLEYNGGISSRNLSFLFGSIDAEECESDGTPTHDVENSKYNTGIFQSPSTKDIGSIHGTKGLVSTPSPIRQEATVPDTDFLQREWQKQFRSPGADTTIDSVSKSQLNDDDNFSEYANIPVELRQAHKFVTKLEKESSGIERCEDSPVQAVNSSIDAIFGKNVPNSEFVPAEYIDRKEDEDFIYYRAPQGHDSNTPGAWVAVRKAPIEPHPINLKVESAETGMESKFRSEIGHVEGPHAAAMPSFYTQRTASTAMQSPTSPPFRISVHPGGVEISGGGAPSGGIAQTFSALPPHDYYWSSMGGGVSGEFRKTVSPEVLAGSSKETKLESHPMMQAQTHMDAFGHTLHVLKPHSLDTTTQFRNLETRVRIKRSGSVDISTVTPGSVPGDLAAPQVGRTVGQFGLSSVPDASSQNYALDSASIAKDEVNATSSKSSSSDSCIDSNGINIVQTPPTLIDAAVLPIVPTNVDINGDTGSQYNAHPSVSIGDDSQSPTMDLSPSPTYCTESRVFSPPEAVNSKADTHGGSGLNNEVRTLGGESGDVGAASYIPEQALTPLKSLLKLDQSGASNDTGALTQEDVVMLSPLVYQTYVQAKQLLQSMSTSSNEQSDVVTTNMKSSIAMKSSISLDRAADEMPVPTLVFSPAPTASSAPVPGRNFAKTQQPLRKNSTNSSDERDQDDPVARAKKLLQQSFLTLYNVSRVHPQASRDHSSEQKGSSPASDNFLQELRSLEKSVSSISTNGDASDFSNAARLIGSQKQKLSQSSNLSQSHADDGASALSKSMLSIPLSPHAQFIPEAPRIVFSPALQPSPSILSDVSMDLPSLDPSPPITASMALDMSRAISMQKNHSVLNHGSVVSMESENVQSNSMSSPMNSPLNPSVIGSWPISYPVGGDTSQIHMVGESHFASISNVPTSPTFTPDLSNTSTNFGLYQPHRSTGAHKSQNSLPPLSSHLLDTLKSSASPSKVPYIRAHSVLSTHMENRQTQIGEFDVRPATSPFHSYEDSDMANDNSSPKPKIVKRSVVSSHTVADLLRQAATLREAARRMGRRRSESVQNHRSGWNQDDFESNASSRHVSSDGADMLKSSLQSTQSTSATIMSNAERELRNSAVHHPMTPQAIASNDPISIANSGLAMAALLRAQAARIPSP